MDVAEGGGERDDLEFRAGEGRDDGEGVVCWVLLVFCFGVEVVAGRERKEEEEVGVERD